MKPTKEVFDVIKANFQDKDKFTIEDIEVFDFVTCTDEFNPTWNMKLKSDFIEGYTKHTNSGKAGMGVLHNGTFISLGRSVQGYSYIANNMSISKFYMAKGINIGNGISSDDIIKALEVGTMFDGSIEFFAGKYECSVCHNDLLDYDSCNHVIGYEYDGQKCYALIGNEGTIYSNYHIVNDGSLESAGITTTLSIENKESAMMPLRFNFSVKNYEQLNIKKQEAIETMENENRDEILKAIQDLREVSMELQKSLDKNKELLEEIDSIKLQHSEELGGLQQDIDSLKDEIAKLQEFKGVYLSVVEEEGVRAYGKEFDKIVLENKSVEDLEKTRLGFIELSVKKRNTSKNVRFEGEVPEETNYEVYKIGG